MKHTTHKTIQKVGPVVPEIMTLQNVAFIWILHFYDRFSFWLDVLGLPSQIDNMVTQERNARKTISCFLLVHCLQI